LIISLLRQEYSITAVLRPQSGDKKYNGVKFSGESVEEIIDIPQWCTGPVIWIISNQQWPRAFLRGELIERGYDAIGFEEPGQVLAAFGDKRTTKPRLVILDLRQSPATRIQLQNLAHKEIATIVLAGNVELEGKLFKDFAWKTVLKTPFTIGQVCSLVEKMIPIESA
jgi:hypothetical protein